MHVTSVVWHCLFLSWLQAARLPTIPSASLSTHGANMNLSDGPYTDYLEENSHDRLHDRQSRSATAIIPSDYDDTDLDSDDNNATELGLYLGGRCKDTCSPDLDNVYCDAATKLCTCEKKFPVRLGMTKGCATPKILGEQCFYSETCSFYDSNAICTQIGHKATCACKSGFHTVGIQKGVKRVFCSEDVVVLHTNLPNLLIVASGIAMLSGLLCFVLKLFSSNRYGQGARYGDANLAPPLLFSSDNQWINGIPLTVHARPSSRSSSQRSNLTHYRSKGVLVPASRAGAARAAAILLIPCHLQNARTPNPPTPPCASSSREDQPESTPGSRRPSISSIQSNASSQLSYSQRRFELENHQREQRAAMRAAREEATRMAVVIPAPTPSPISTDHLLPSCEELNEDDPLGIVSSALSISSAASPNESTSVSPFPTGVVSYKV